MALMRAQSDGEAANGEEAMRANGDWLAVDARNERYPFCIVWTPIPCLTYLLPFVGHMGIADSRGVIYDFAGPYTVTVDNFAFGKTTRYLRLFAKEEITADLAEEYDEAVRAASKEYCSHMHNLCWDNCHSHVGLALSKIRYRGSQRWGMVVLAGWVFFAGKFVNFSRFLQSVLPSLVIYGVIIAMVYFT